MSLNLDLYHKIRDERKKLGLYVADLNVPIEDSEYLGRRYIKKSTNEEWVVKKVAKHWLEGWYIVLLLDRVSDGSSALRFVENINCQRESIVDKFGKFEREYEWVKN